LNAHVGEFDEIGDELWNVTWGGSYNNIANAITVDLQGNLYIAGYSSKAPLNEGFLIKICFLIKTNDRKILSIKIIEH